MSEAVVAEREKIRPGDVVITLLLLALFAGAYVYALDWPFRTAFFPKLVAAAGVAFAVLKLVGFGVRMTRRSGAEEPASEAPTPDGVELVNEDEEEDRSLEYVFSTAGGRAWAAALGWLAAFFVLLYVAGVFVAVPVFAFAYLKVAGKAGWLGALLYAGLSAGLLWLAFSRLLSVPMPRGIL